MQHVGVERKPAKEYFEIAKEVLQLSKSFSDKSAIIPAYSEKESFGDLDCLAVISPTINTKESLKELFRPTDIQKNGDVWSFDYRKLQIDIICTSHRLFDVALHYYSYNDVSNLIGRVANKMGLKYGHRGLTYPVKANNSNVIGTVELSIQPSEILPFLGYDYDRFQKGFRDLEEIYTYVISSAYFDKTSFQEENLNHINRIRNRKRPTFTNFVQWLEQPKNADIPSFTYEKDKTPYIQKALDYFKHNNTREQLQVILASHKKHEEAKTKFNGKLVSKITGLQSRELGELISNFAKQWGNRKELESWVLTSTPAQIHQAITEFHRKHTSMDI